MDHYHKERGQICTTLYLQDWKLNKKACVKTGPYWKKRTRVFKRFLPSQSFMTVYIAQLGTNRKNEISENAILNSD